MTPAAVKNPNIFLQSLSYLRAPFIVLVVLLATLIFAILIVVQGLLNPGGRSGDYWAHLWAIIICAVSGLEVEIRGLERLPSSGGLMLFNHTSNYDIFLMMKYFYNLKLKFGAKAELFKIPIFGRAMLTVGALPIERKNRARVLKIYKQAESRMNQGETFALAPEGTRQKNFNLGSYRDGPFLFGIGAQGPIIPLVIAGALPIMPPKSIFANWGVWKRKVILEVLPPFPTSDLTEEDAKALKNNVRAAMLAKYDELKTELGYPEQTEASSARSSATQPS